MDYHYTWEFARHFEPLIGWLHRRGLFNFYVHIPVETALAIALYIWVRARVRRTGYLDSRKRFSRFFWHSIYFSICWIAMASFGVGLKTMIVEELDYQERKWFEPYLSPSHLYISSVAFAYLFLITKSKSSYYDLLCALYIQIGLIAGSVVACYRMLNEDIEGATGGALLLLFFAVCNYDLIRRARRILSVNVSARSSVPA
ncbi:MAG TPA: hypothetical protein VLD57_10175 [Blastocatellia bacterium]|nr:hypothetical protein [Blastocatellia bacterium]